MRRTRWLAAAVLSVFGVFVVLFGGMPEEAEAQSYEAAEIETVELINAYRQENGLGTLSLSSPLSVASERHSEDMGTYGFFAHDTVQSSYYEPGVGHSERVAQEGYDFNTFTAENLAFGQATPQEVFEAWRNSPGHNAAMLGDYSVVGIGLVNVGGVPYWTTVFGAEVDSSASPVGAAPSSSNEAPAEGEPTAQTDQYDDAATDQYENAEIEDAEIENTEIETEPVASEDQYNEPDTEAPTSGQYGEDAEAPGTSAADQYLENADRFRAAADQYGEEARQAEAEIAALQATQTEPTATPASATPASAAPVSAPPASEAPASTGGSSADGSSSVGAVSPEPQIAAPDSAAQEIPVPNIENAGAVQSAGQSEEISDEGSDETSESPSEAMASVGMTVLPDTGGLPLGSILGAALVACVLVTARRFIG